MSVGPHVDAGVEQLEHVLPALDVPAARRVRVRELVDEDQRGLPRERRVEVELLERDAAVVDRRAAAAPPGPRAAPRSRRGRGSRRRRRRRRSPSRLRAPRRLEHRVRLADARRRAEEDLEPRALRAHLLGLDLREQRIGIGPIVARRVVAHVDHSTAAVRSSRSSARFSASTLTRGSPSMPSVRSSTCASTSARTSARREPPRARDAVDLVVRRRRRDVRIEPRRRGGDEIDRAPARCCPGRRRAAPRCAPATASASAGLTSARRFAARSTLDVALYGNGPRPTAGSRSSRVRERLSDQLRADDAAAVAISEPFALVREQRLAECRSRARIDDAGQHGEREQRDAAARSDAGQISLHDTQPQAGDQHVDQLDERERQRRARRGRTRAGSGAASPRPAPAGP